MRGGATSGKTPSMPRIAALIALALLGACSTLDPGGESEATSSSTFPATSTSGGDTGAPTTGVATSGTTAADTGDLTGSSSGGDGGMAVDYDMAGGSPVGNGTFILPVGGRDLLVEVWYPADAAAAPMADKGESILEFIPAGPDRDAFDMLMAAQTEAIKAGVRAQTHSARGAAASGASSYPLIVFSHCHNCTRFSGFSIAEHLASRGFVVAAPDHVGNTLFDALAGSSAEIGEEFLLVRIGDMSALLDALLDPGSQAVPEAIRGKIDPARVGAMGHSFGAATAGRLAQEDDRVKAAMAIAAPVENPFFPGTKVAQIVEPLLFVLAVEDNSILQIGNNLIEANFDAKTPPAYFVGVDDAGHFGVTDICGITGDLTVGCGPGTRMTDGTPFTYLSPVQLRAIVAAYAAAFFDLHLLGNPAGLEYLQTASPPRLVTVDARL